MPTIPQLPAAGQTTASDELPISQGGITRGVTVGDLLAGTQPAIIVPTGAVLGRTSAGPGGPEPLAVSSGLTLSNGALTANGQDHAGFPLQAVLSPMDEVILNSTGAPRRLALPLLRGLFSAGSNVVIGSDGTISATGDVGGVAGPTGPIGPVGPTGPVGPAGASGPPGPVGTPGPTGASGSAGVAGLAGPSGPAGPTGPTGPAGLPGPSGVAGQVGPAGAMGPTGPAGSPGFVGPAGPVGPTGVVGPAGPVGPAGLVGPAGPTGVAGPAGPPGSSVTITGAQVVGDIGATDLIGISQGGVDRAISYQDLLNGRLITDQPPNAVQMSDTDVFWLGQGSPTMVIGTLQRVADYINTKIPTYARKRVEESGSVALIAGRHNRAVVSFPSGGAVTVRQFFDCGDGFECTLINTSAGGTVTLGAGIACTGLSTLAPGQSAQLLGVHNSNNSQAVYAQTPVSGIVPSIEIGTVPNVAAHIAFSVAGTIFNYTTTPTLQYSDNSGATWNSLPSGSSVTVAGFSFVHPGLSPQSDQTVLISDGANPPKQSNSFNVEAATILAPSAATGAQSTTVSLALTGITTAYMVWMNGAAEVGMRVAVSGALGAIPAPSTAGNYTLAIWDAPLTGAGILLATSSVVAVAAPPSEVLVVNTPASVAAGQNVNVSGTYTNGNPAGLAWSIDGVSYVGAPTPIIAGGAFSFAIPALPAGGPYTIRVRDTGLPAVIGAAAGTFSVESGALGSLPSFAANQTATVPFVLTGISAAYLGWWNGSVDVNPRVAVSGSSGLVAAPAAGTYTLRLYDSAAGSIVLDSRTGVAVVAEAISVALVPATPAIDPISVSGTYSNSTPTALDWSVNGGSTWSAAAAPTIGNGVYSFSIPVGAIPAGVGYVLLVKDHSTGTQGGTLSAFNVYSAIFTNAPTGSSGSAVSVAFGLTGISTVYLVWMQAGTEMTARVAVSGTTAVITAPAAGAYALAIYDSATPASGNQLASTLVTITSVGPPADTGLTSIGVPNPIVFFDANNGQALFADGAFSSVQAASGGIVKGLRDTSGNGYDLYQPGTTAPTLALAVQNGRNGLLFSKASSQFLQQVSSSWVAGLQGSPLTVLLVFKIVSDANSGSPYIAASISNSSNNDAHNAFSVSASTISSPNVQAARHSAAFASAKDTSLGSAAKNTLLKVIARFDAVGNLVHVAVNGHTDISAATTGPYAGGSLAAWDSFLLGKQPAGATPFYLDGYLFEVNVWNTFLSDPAKLASLALYATNKWGS